MYDYVLRNGWTWAKSVNFCERMQVAKYVLLRIFIQIVDVLGHDFQGKNSNRAYLEVHM